MEPAFICAYGVSGVGKTMDALYSFPEALFIAMPGALKPSRQIFDWEPRRAIVPGLHELCVLLTQLTPNVVSAVVIDDFSLLVDVTFSDLEKKYTGFHLWGALRDYILLVRRLGRQLGIHVLLNAHAIEARTAKGRFVRGGPKLPGTMSEDFPTACDTVVRAVMGPPRVGYRGQYRATMSDDPNWVAKDREGRFWDGCPMNTAELLRSAGYVLPRPVPYRWMDDAVEDLAQALEPKLGDPQLGARLEAVVGPALAAKCGDVRLAKWVLRDALDRAIIRNRQKMSAFSMFGPPAVSLSTLTGTVDATPSAAAPSTPLGSLLTTPA